MADAMDDLDRLIERVEAGEFRKPEGGARYVAMHAALEAMDMAGAVMLLAVQTALRNSDADCAAVLRAYRTAEGGGA